MNRFQLQIPPTIKTLIIRWAPLLLVTILFLLFFLKFPELYNQFSLVAGAFVLAPVVLAGLLYGLLGGIIAGLIAFILGLFLFNTVEPPVGLVNLWPAAFFTLAIGVGAGYFHDLTVRLRVALAQRLETEIALNKANEALEERVGVRVAELLASNDAVQAELEKRRAAEERLRALFEAMTDVILVMDRDGRYLEIPPTNPKLLYKPPEEIIGLTLAEVFPPDQAQMFMAHIEETIATQAAVHFEYSLPIAGRTMWFAGVFSPLPGERVLLVARDITESKLAYEALQESEERFRLIVKGAQDYALFMLDTDGRIVNWNPGAERLKGYRANEIVGQHFSRFYESADVARGWSEQLLTAARTKGYVEDQGWRVRKDGSRFWANVTITALHDDSGQLRGFSKLTRDMTAYKQSEQALQRSEAQLAEAMRIAQLGAWEYDVLTDRFTFNDQFYRLLHTTAEQEGGYEMSLAQYAQRFVHPDDAPGVGREIQKALETSDTDYQTQLDHRIIRADGEMGHVSVRIRVEKDAHGKTLKTHGVNQDITARRLAQAALRESEEKFRTLVEKLQVGVLLQGPQAEVLLCNQAALDLLGVSAEQILGRSSFTPDWTIFHEDGSPYVTEEQPTPRAIATRQPVRNDVMGVNHPSYEKRRWLLVNAEPQLALDGSVRQVICTFADITDRKQAADEIQRQSARAYALARMAARLNARLDLETVLAAICEETTQALGVPLMAVSLYDARRDKLVVAASHGVPTEVIGQLRPIAPSVYETHAQKFGPLLVIPDIQAIANLPDADLYTQLDIRTVAGVQMIRDGQFVGRLAVVTTGAVRSFSQDELGLLQGLADQASQAIVNARLYEEAESRLRRTQALRDIDMAITGSLSLPVTLDVVLQQVESQLQVDASAVLLLKGGSNTLEYGAGRGFRTNQIRQMSRRLGEGNAGRAALERRTIFIPNLREAGTQFKRIELLDSENFVSYFAVPLVAKAKVRGVLEIFHRKKLDPDDEWLEFMNALAGQAAIAIDSAQLFNELQRANTELLLAYDTTIEGWSAALDLRDKETEGHTQRVTELTMRLAHALGYSEETLVSVRHGALLHDIGKMGVPDHILLKPGQLTEEEWEHMRKHPTYAYELLSPIAYLRSALDIPYCHHEKWDGTGYPRGLKGEQIPLAARLFAVVDVWDALCSDRPYRKGWPEAKVREHIKSLAGTHFDPEVVNAFLRLTL